MSCSARERWQSWLSKSDPSSLQGRPPQQGGFPVLEKCSQHMDGRQQRLLTVSQFAFSRRAVPSLRGPMERNLASQIVRLIVAGNALSAAQSPSPAGSMGLPASSSTSPLASSSAVTSNASSAVSLKTVLQEADVYLSQFASSIPVDLMPGPEDPTTYALPQRPLHSALLPCSRSYASIRGVPNPHSFALDQVILICSSFRVLPLPPCRQDAPRLVSMLQTY